MHDILVEMRQLLLALLANSLATLLLLAIICSIGVLIYAQYRKDDFDLRSLVVDPKTNRPSVHQLGQLTALVISSWGLVVLVLHDKLTEVYFTTYMAVWAGSNTLDRLLRTREGGDERVRDDDRSDRSDKGDRGGDH
jgi:predicted signal transduction protein with EAL and GGDEF domain